MKNFKKPKPDISITLSRPTAQNLIWLFMNLKKEKTQPYKDAVADARKVLLRNLKNKCLIN